MAVTNIQDRTSEVSQAILGIPAQRLMGTEPNVFDHSSSPSYPRPSAGKPNPRLDPNDGPSSPMPKKPTPMAPGNPDAPTLRAGPPI